MKQFLIPALVVLTFASVGASPTPSLATDHDGASATWQVAANDQRNDNQRRDDQRGNDRNGSKGQRYDWNSYKPGTRPPARPDAKFDQRSWQRTYTAQRRFRTTPYRRPAHWYYRQWSYGSILPAAFWARDYWLTDYWQYGLPDPPYGYVWVRYASDALLVDVSSGRILQVYYSLFY